MCNLRRVNTALTLSEQALLESIGLKKGWVLLRYPVTLVVQRGALWALALFSLPVFIETYAKGSSLAASLGYGLAGSLGILLTLVAHEYGHLYMARYARGVTPRLVLVRAVGGVAICEGRYEDARGATLFSAGGPAVTLLCTLSFGAATLVSHPWPGTHAVCSFIALINVLLLVVNLLPLAPMDGYMLLRNGLWALRGSRERGEQAALLVSKCLLAGSFVTSVALLAVAREAALVTLFLLATLYVQHHFTARSILAATRRHA
jgi:Zn-dependent protease